MSTDGEGLVSRAGVALLRELTEDTGLVAGWTNALLDTYQTFPAAHFPGRVLADLAVVIADGGDALAHLATLRDQQKLLGVVASDATAWRCVERVDDAHLQRLRSVRAAARDRAWPAGAGPDLADGLVIDIDATITIAHSDKINAAKTWKKTYGFHPLLAYLDRPDVSGGEGLAGILRPGNAGSNTTADHVEILGMALAALPEHARPRPEDPDSPQVLIRTDAAGATYGFAAACRTAGCGFSLGYALDQGAQAAIVDLPDDAWSRAYDIDGDPRDGAWVAELTGLLDLSKWPNGSRVIVRRERPHPGAQLRFTDADGHRVTAFITDTSGGPGRQHADLEVRHRSHARVEDRIRCGKATGLPNLPCRGYQQNKVWLELALTAADLLTGPRRSAWMANWPAANRQRCVTGSFTSPPASSAPDEPGSSRSTATGPGPPTSRTPSPAFAPHPGQPEPDIHYPYNPTNADRPADRQIASANPQARDLQINNTRLVDQLGPACPRTPCVGRGR